MPNRALQDMFLKRYSCRGHQVEQRSNCKFKAKNFDSCIDKSDFSSELKEKKKKDKSDKTNYTDQEVYFLIALKSMKKLHMINFISIMTIYFSQANANFKNDRAHKIVF